MVMVVKMMVMVMVLVVGVVVVMVVVVRKGPSQFYISQLPINRPWRRYW